MLFKCSITPLEPWSVSRLCLESGWITNACFVCHCVQVAQHLAPYLKRQGPTKWSGRLTYPWTSKSAHLCCGFLGHDVLRGKKQTGMRWVKLDCRKKNQNQKRESSPLQRSHLNGAGSFWVLRLEFSLTVNKPSSEDLRHFYRSNVGVSIAPCYLLSYFLNHQEYHKAIWS